MFLTDFAYEWCSAIWENRDNLEDWESLLLVCLEVGFRHLDPWRPPTDITRTHAKLYQGLVDAIFKSQKSEPIADLLHAWTAGYVFTEQAGAMINIGTGYLVDLNNLLPFSPRLRRLVIRFVGLAGYKGFVGAGVEKLTELLDHLHVTVEDVDRKKDWMSLLLDVIRSSEGIQHLSCWYWELLVELAVSEPWWLGSNVTDGRKITESLVEAQEWGRLECWIRVVWMLPELPDVARMTEEDLESSMLLLFRQRPDAAQNLERWIEQWSQQRKDILELFQPIFTRAQEAVRGEVAP